MARLWGLWPIINRRVETEMQTLPWWKPTPLELQLFMITSGVFLLRIYKAWGPGQPLRHWTFSLLLDLRMWEEKKLRRTCPWLGVYLVLCLHEFRCLVLCRVGDQFPKVWCPLHILTRDPRATSCFPEALVRVHFHQVSLCLLAF